MVCIPFYHYGHRLVSLWGKEKEAKKSKDLNMNRYFLLIVYVNRLFNAGRGSKHIGPGKRNDLYSGEHRCHS